MSTYEKPNIVLIDHFQSSKYGLPQETSMNFREKIEGHDMKELTEKYGSPLFVFSEKKIREKYDDTTSKIRDVYPDVQFAWSYKTNYLKSICSIFHDMGSWAEVVSDFEYQKARNLGIKGENIIYNGPYKPIASLRVAVKEQALIHIDHLQEIIDLESVAKELGMTPQVAIRLNMNTGTYPQWSRFGFNLESGQAEQAIRRIMNKKLFKLRGLHTHIGTFMLEPKAYEAAAVKLTTFMLEIEAQYKIEIEYLDLGGGFPSKSDLKGVYQPPEIVVKDTTEYARLIGPAILNNIGTRKPPKLIFESGRHFIDEAGYLLTTVVSSKIMPDTRRSYILDAGVNFLYTSTWYNFTLEVNQQLKGIPEPAILNGPLCMNIDIIEEDLKIPHLKTGTQMVLSPVGAYNVTQWMQFIRYRPAVVLLTKDKKVEIIRNMEDLSSVEKDEVLYGGETGIS